MLFGGSSDDYAALRGLRCDLLVIAAGDDHVTSTAVARCVTASVEKPGWESPTAPRPPRLD